MLRGFFLGCSLVLGASCSQTTSQDTNVKSCNVQFMILGTSQDAGTPQIGNSNDRAWSKYEARRLAASAALIDQRHQKRYLFEATPDIRQQLKELDDAFPISNDDSLGIANIFITHAHIGHYAGLMFLGRESAGTKNVGVNVMPRMAKFLRENGPWDQLVSLGNINLESNLSDGQPLYLADDLSVTPLRVPHRDEYSETVGFVIIGPNRSVLFLPDIDDWEQWKAEYNRDISDIVSSVDAAFIDATFYDNHELPGRDMTKIPHPRVIDSMRLLKDQAEKVHFIHINHTNPLRNLRSDEVKNLQSHGFNVAWRGQKICL